MNRTRRRKQRARRERRRFLERHVYLGSGCWAFSIGDSTVPFREPPLNTSWVEDVIESFEAAGIPEGAIEHTGVGGWSPGQWYEEASGVDESWLREFLSGRRTISDMIRRQREGEER